MKTFLEGDFLVKILFLYDFLDFLRENGMIFGGVLNLSFLPAVKKVPRCLQTFKNYKKCLVLGVSGKVEQTSLTILFSNEKKFKNIR